MDTSEVGYVGTFGRGLLPKPGCSADATCRRSGADWLQARPIWRQALYLAVDNTLDRRFDAEAPDKAWVTDVTYIRTVEGFA